MAKPAPQYLFGPFKLDPQAGELQCDEVTVRLQEKPLRLLLALLEQPGQVVRREELCRRLWPDGTQVDFEHGLGNALHKLREALRDSADQPLYVETVPRRGYRFLMPVESRNGRQASGLSRSSGSSVRWGRTWRLLAVCGLLAALALWAAFSGQGVNPPVHPLSANFEAREAYLRGQHFFERKTSRDIQLSVDYFRQAIQRDPRFAEAWASLAYAYHFSGAMGLMSTDEAYQRSAEAAQAALGINDRLAKAEAILAETTFRFGPNNAAEVEDGFLRALQLDPSSSEIHHWYGNYLAAQGRPRSGLKELREAHRLDPLSLHVAVDLASHLYLADNRKEALKLLERTLELDADYPKTHYLAGFIAAKEGRPDEAVEHFRRVVELSPDVPKFLYALAKAYIGAGRLEEGEQTLHHLANLPDRYVPSALLHELEAEISQASRP